MFDLAVCETHHVVPQGPEGQVPASVVLERGTAAMVDVAVGFGNEPSSSPEEIDEMLADADVDLGSRQPMPATEREEVFLQIAALPPAPVFLLDRQPEDVCLPDRTSQLTGRDQAPLAGRHPAQIRDRPGRGRNRDATAKPNCSR